MDALEIGKAIMANQPFSVLLGAEVISFEQGRVELGLVLKAEHMNQHAAAHGGLISYMADNALTYAGGSVLGVNCVTLEMKINYVKPGRGTRLIARARVAGAGKSQAVCQCDVFGVDENGAETLCAIAQGTIWKVS